VSKKETVRNNMMGMRNANQVIRKRTPPHTRHEKELVLRQGKGSLVCQGVALLERFRMNSPSLPPRKNLEVTVSSVTSIFPLLKKIPYFLKKCRNSVSEISQFWFA